MDTQRQLVSKSVYIYTPKEADIAGCSITKTRFRNQHSCTNTVILLVLVASIRFECLMAPCRLNSCLQVCNLYNSACHFTQSIHVVVGAAAAKFEMLKSFVRRKLLASMHKVLSPVLRWYIFVLTVTKD